VGARKASINLFQVDLEKTHNSLWLCYEKAPLPLLPPFQKRKGNTPIISPLSGVPEITYDAVM